MEHLQRIEQEGMTRGSIVSRRTFLLATAGASAAMVVATAFKIDALAQEDQDSPILTGYQFFTTPQARTVGAIAERIWPATDESAGAIEVGVVFYIDHALAGEYREFQGDYRNGIDAINALARSEYDASFASLSAEQQQSLLERIEAGELASIERSVEDQGMESLAPSTRETEPPADDGEQQGESTEAADASEEPAPAMHRAAGASTAAAVPVGATLAGTSRRQVAGLTPPQDASLQAFFDLVHAHTMEGLFSDPIYGGNRDFAGWRPIRYPGAHYVYTEEEQQSFEPLDKPIQSIADI